MTAHYRRDSPKGVTAPNPDAARDIIQHITKHRGQKTPYTSVSEDAGAIGHFSGVMYETEPDDVERDSHEFIDHSNLTELLRAQLHGTNRGERVLAARALQLAARAKEALIDWRFALDGVARKDRVSWCYARIQKYFRRI